MKKLSLLMLTLSFVVSLCACGSSVSTSVKNSILETELNSNTSVDDRQSQSTITDNNNTSENTSYDDNTEDDPTVAPSEEYVLSRLRLIDTITVAEAVTEEHDPNGMLGKQGGYIGCIFFRDSQVDQSTLYVEEGKDKDDVIDVGTQGGGCLEIYENVKDAEKRDAYLSGFDGTALSSGSHRILGTVLIRTSNELKVSQQNLLTEKIANALLSDEIVPTITSSQETTETQTPKPTKKTKPTNTPTPEPLPVVTMDEILTGSYDGKTVILGDCVVDDFNDKDLILWVKNSNGSYTSYIDVSAYEIPDYYPEDLKNGDIVDVRGIPGGVFGGYFETETITAFDVKDHIDISKVYESYAKQCQPLDYEAVLRSPDKYDHTYCYASGKIEYVEEDGSTSGTYVIQTEDGPIKVFYVRRPEPRFIKGDDVTVYGYLSSGLVDTYLQIDKVPYFTAAEIIILH